LRFECIIKSIVVMENRVNELSPGTSPACISCSLWKSGRRHKTYEERVIEFYGYLPSSEEMKAMYPKLDWEPVNGAVGHELW
jgi:hypothetical protein